MCECSGDAVYDVFRRFTPPREAGPAGIFLAPDGDRSMELKKLAAIRESD